LKKIKIIALAIMLAFLATAPGFVNADETMLTPNKLVVFKISDYNYYTQDIGSDKVNKVKMDAAPLIKDNRTFVPVRFLGNALGVTDSNIQWDKATRTATLKGKAELKLKDGEKAVTTNGNKQTIDVAPYIIPPGRTMLPARYVAEGLGFTVEWDKANQLAICYPAGTQKPDMSKVLQEITGQSNKPIVKRPKADLNNQGGLTSEQSQEFRKELEKSIKMDRANNTISFYLPLLPEGFEWDIGLNQHFGPKPDDSYYILHDDNRLADGQSYTFEVDYNKMTRGYFTFGPCKKGLVRADMTSLNLKTGKVEYYERAW